MRKRSAEAGERSTAAGAWARPGPARGTPRSLPPSRGRREEPGPGLTDSAAASCSSTARAHESVAMVRAGGWLRARHRSRNGAGRRHCACAPAPSPRVRAGTVGAALAFRGLAGPSPTALRREDTPRLLPSHQRARTALLFCYALLRHPRPWPKISDNPSFELPQVPAGRSRGLRGERRKAKTKSGHRQIFNIARGRFRCSFVERPKRNGNGK